MTHPNEQPIVLPEGEFAVIIDDEEPIRRMLTEGLCYSPTPLEAIGARNVVESERVFAAATEAGRAIAMAMFDGMYPFGDQRDSNSEMTPTQASLAALDEHESKLAEQAQQRGEPAPRRTLRVYIGASKLDNETVRRTLGISEHNFHRTPGKPIDLDTADALAKEATQG